MKFSTLLLLGLGGYLLWKFWPKGQNPLDLHLAEQDALQNMGKVTSGNMQDASVPIAMRSGGGMNGMVFIPSLYGIPPVPFFYDVWQPKTMN